MGALGIVTEYNPFHNGHLLHLRQSRQLTGRAYTIAVMSGHFVQRGEPALLDKWTRTRMALVNGVNLVLELPVYFSTAAAEHFARAAVQLLDAAGIVDCLCFGSESGDLEAIMNASALLAAESQGFQGALKEQLSRGLPFASAREAAYGLTCGAPEGLLSQANNILGVEYCKALRRLGSAITPYTLRRESGASFLAARSIRQAVKNGALDGVKPVMPPSAFEALEEAVRRGEVADINHYGDILQYLLRTLPVKTLREVSDMTEGLENRFRRECGRHRELSHLLAAVKTKRYSYTRLQRVALHVLLGLKAKELLSFEAEGGPPYIRVLGFRRDSAFLLKELHRKSSLPVLTNLKHAEKILTEPGLRLLRKEAEATGLYALARGKNTFPIDCEYAMPMVML